MSIILIRGVDALSKLLTWRDMNKDIVRAAPIPVIDGVALNEGSIVYGGHIEVAFKREKSIVNLQFFAGGRQYVSLVYDFLTWKMTDVDYRAQEIPYPMDSALQDILTVYASTMAFIHANPDKVIRDGGVLELSFDDRPWL